MAQILSFHYRPGTSALHRGNASLKFLLYIILNLVLASAGFPGMLINLMGLGVIAVTVGVSILKVMKELRIFVWIFLISYISRAHLSDGTAVEIVLFSRSISFSWNSEGALETLRFILLIFNSVISTHLLMSTTRLSDLQNGIYRILYPVHPVFAWRISTMLKIMLGAIPRLLDAANDSDRRLRLRGLLKRKQPLQYLKGMGLLMLQHISSISTSFTTSLLLRAWNENGPGFAPRAVPPGKVDFLLLGSAAVLAISALML